MALLALMPCISFAEDLNTVKRSVNVLGDVRVISVIGEKNKRIHILTIMHKEELLLSFNLHGKEKKLTIYPVEQIQVDITENGDEIQQVELRQKGNSDFYYSIFREGNEFVFDKGELHDFMKKAKGYIQAQ
jgi:rRNA maturation protein Rpf1